MKQKRPIDRLNKCNYICITMITCALSFVKIIVLFLVAAELRLLLLNKSLNVTHVKTTAGSISGSSLCFSIYNFNFCLNPLLVFCCILWYRLPGCWLADDLMSSETAAVISLLEGGSTEICLAFCSPLCFKYFDGFQLKYIVT